VSVGAPRVLDTDTCIELMRGNDRVLECRAGHRGDVVTTWMTAAELYFGAARSSRPEHNARVVDAFLSTLDVLSMDAASARIFGDAKARLRSAGVAPADADLLIGSIAAARGAVIVTGNRAHFERFPGLLIEDWIRG
jgi:tRNA(fMet)-specific endonuclease VapC